jgi:hypothetical protein
MPGPSGTRLEVQPNRLEVVSQGTQWRRRDRLVPALVFLALIAVIPLELHSKFGHGDIDLYHRYAQAFWLGTWNSPPLRSLPLEYPPLSIIPFSLSLLPPLSDYITVYALWMLGIVAAGYFAIRRYESERAAEVYAVYCLVGGLSTLLGRFDLVPALILVAAYWTARARRFDLAYTLVAAGTLIKLYPLLLLPVIVLEHWRALGSPRLLAIPPRPVLRGVGLFAGLVVVGFAVARILNPDGWLSPFTYNTVRPIQVESVPATILWVGSWMGLPAWPDHSFHSFNLVGPLTGSLNVLSTLALLGGCSWIYWRQLTGHISFVRALLACTLVIICSSRVFSPQYLLWVIPFVAAIERKYDLVWLAVCVLTTLIYPFAYRGFQLYGLTTPESYPVLFLALIGARNALLVVATARYLLPHLGAQRRPIEVEDRAAQQVA